MHDIDWSLVITASLMLIVIPGQDMLLVMSGAIAQGASAGLATAGGVCTGLVVHTLVATLGLGAVIVASESLYLALRLAGAAYLAWLGLQLLRVPHGELAFAGAAPKRSGRLFLEGAVSNVCNPKIVVFYLAFLPQFVAPGSAHATRSIFILGIAFALLAMLVKGPIGLGAGALAGWLRAHPVGVVWAFRASGALLVGLAAQLMLQAAR